jgi:argininosuccinate synthase
MLEGLVDVYEYTDRLACAEFYNRFAGRSALLEYAAQQGIPVVQTAAKPWSTGES